MQTRDQSTFERILVASHEEIYLFNATTYKFIQVSQGTLANLGYTHEEMMSLTPIDIKPQITATQFNRIVDPLLSGDKEIIYFETVHERKDGTIYDVDVRLQYINDVDEPIFLALVTDITQRKHDDKELRKLAFIDSGTELYNKRYFISQLDITLTSLSRNHNPLGIILIDLDHFGNINNTYGHIVGDKLIAEISKRMQSVFSRKDDIVARYGGDEFVILCQNMDYESFKLQCNKLLDRIKEEIVIDTITMTITASIGGYFTDGNENEDSQKVLTRVDSIMYRAKNSGRNELVVEKNTKVTTKLPMQLNF